MATAQRPVLRASLTLPAERASAAAARRFVGDMLASWHLRDLAETATLLTSELVTNALLHAGSAMSVRLTRDTAMLRVEVGDTAPAHPTPRAPGPDADTGRGLALVEMLASSWGVTARPLGKSVWFELPLPAGPAP